MGLHSLMFGWEYPPLHLGGLGIACQGLVRGLLKNGVKVTLVLPRANPDGEDPIDVRFPTEDMLETVQVKSMLTPYQTVQDYVAKVNTLDRSAQQIYGHDLAEAIERFTAASVRMTKDVRADVVHCHDWMTYEAGIRAAHYHRKPLVAHIHATELDRTHFHPNPWIYDREKRGFDQASRIIAVSNYTKNVLTTHYGIAGDKITVVHNGNHVVYDERPHVLSARHGESRKPMVLFLGRLTLQKGPVQFLEMAKVVHEYRPDVQFVMAGDGHMLPELMERAIDLGLSDALVFAGRLSGSEVQQLFSQADCFVMPSASEPFGLVTLEAIAQGTPVIISKQSGVCEVVRHAFVVDFWDTAKMADCVLTVLREEPLAMQLTSEAPSVLQRLTWENQARIVSALYKDLATHSSQRSMIHHS